ncbi:hypothetical protein NE237_029272 [Protea cynaroides]|uniref:Uncharacterized protein n=1 Tax=Protea cynaroides TaxID=273540 RepID=A0A9Q0GRZ3_9MAGN|nr:hypothetical protein NE237_029272 [Protea cynaroides]
MLSTNLCSSLLYQPCLPCYFFQKRRSEEPEPGPGPGSVLFSSQLSLLLRDRDFRDWLFMRALNFCFADDQRLYRKRFGIYLIKERLREGEEEGQRIKAEEGGIYLMEDTRFVDGPSLI